MRDLYRRPAGEQDVRGWCLARLDAWPTPHDTSTVSTFLGETHLVVAGEGPVTCLYLPGTNFNAATSTPVLDALARRHRVVCADLPGQPGLSAAGRPSDELAGYSAWVADVLAHLAQADEPGQVVLVGHSRGAAVALTADPASVAGLVLASPAGLCQVRLTAAVLRATVPWLLRPDERRSARLVEVMTGGGPVGQLEDLVAWMGMVARSTRTSGAPSPLPSSTLDRWRGRRVAVLAGEHDVFFPPERLAGPAREHLGIEVGVLPGAGHLLVDERPDSVAAAVDRAHGPRG